MFRFRSWLRAFHRWVSTNLGSIPTGVRWKRIARGKPRNLNYHLTVTSLEPRVVPATNTWTGGTTGSWSIGANWSSGNVPISTDNVVIPTGDTVTLSDGNAYSIDTLTVASGATLQITSGSSIAATASTGTQITDDGTIDIGDSSTPGSLFVSAASGTISGTNANTCFIVFGSNASNIVGTNYAGSSTLNITGLTIEGANGTVGPGPASTSASITSTVATINANTSGGVIDVTGASWQNFGILEAEGGSLNINATSFTNENAGLVFTQNSGSIVTVASPTLTNYASGTLTGGTWYSSEGGSLVIDTATPITTIAANVDLGGGSITSGTPTPTLLQSSLTTIASGGTLDTANSSYTFANALSDSGTLGVFGTSFTDSATLSVQSGGVLENTGSNFNFPATITANVTNSGHHLSQRHRRYGRYAHHHRQLYADITGTLNIDVPSAGTSC